MSFLSGTSYGVIDAIDFDDINLSIDDVMSMMGELLKRQQDSIRHFKVFMGHVLKKGVFDMKTKELIVVGTSITARCTSFIVLHVKKELDEFL